MGKLMKFFYGLMLVVLALLGAILLALGLGNYGLVDYFLQYIRYPLTLNIILGLGIVLLLFAVLILTTLIKESNKGFDILLEDEKGSVLLTRKSLESVMEKSINKFLGVESVSTKATIIENERIEAKALVNYSGNEEIKTLSDRIRTEIIKNLEDFTEISDVRLDLKLDKKEEERKDGR